MRKNVFQIVKAASAAVIASLVFVLIFTLIIQLFSLPMNAVKPVIVKFKERLAGLSVPVSRTKVFSSVSTSTTIPQIPPIVLTLLPGFTASMRLFASSSCFLRRPFKSAQHYVFT